MDEELKPCPMCSKSVAVVTTSSEMFPELEDTGNAESWAVVCSAEQPNGPGGCGASGGFRPTEAEAIAAWNRRAPAQPEPAAPTEPAPGWCKHCRQYTIEEPLQAVPTDATLDQMAGKAWDRFQRHTAELQALENCRLYAARHRKEEWSAVIRRFCAEGGATGSPLREAAPTVVEPVDDVAYHELTDAECDEFRRHRGDFNSMLRSVHSDGHYRHAGRLIAHLGAVFNERFDRAIAATPPRAALTAQQLDALIQAHVGGSELQDGEYSAMVIFAAAVERAHGIAADRGEK